MSAPVITADGRLEHTEAAGPEPADGSERAPAERPDGTAGVRLVLAVEGMDTSDRRYINPGALSPRPFPLTIYAQVRSTHGADGDAATWVVGAITEAERVPGPSILQRSTGQPFPEGTFAWIGTGWMYTDVPSPESGSKSAYTLMKDRALYGNSVDLANVDAEFQYPAGAMADSPPDRIVMHSGEIGSTTIVGIPAFMDAFAEVDGEIIDAPPEALVAAADALETGARISFRSVELGDGCTACDADQETETATTDQQAVALAAELYGDDLEPAALDFSTSGMVALIPADPELLAVPGGDPAGQLHLPIAYLGDEVTSWTPEQIAAVHQAAREATDMDARCKRYQLEAIERGDEPEDCDMLATYPSQEGPLTGNVFAHAVFNPNGGEHQPATVYLMDGTADRAGIEVLYHEICNFISHEVGEATFPDQHADFVPYVTAGYGLPVAALNYTGPVVFDRLRVAIGNQRTDYPLGGGTPVVAAAAPLPPAEHFANPQLTELTPHTVTEDGRVFGHLCGWDTCHTSFTGRCTTPPRSSTGYAYFMVHNTRAQTADGATVEIPVGYGTLSQSAAVGGHASDQIRMGAADVAKHYDNTGTVVMEFAVGEDDHGVWYSGRLLPGLSEREEHLARGVTFSGDWRRIRGGMELVAALGVVTPGFPVPRTRVLAGEPVALVAAGIAPLVEATERAGLRAQMADLGPEFRETLEWVRQQRMAGLRADLDALLAQDGRDDLEELTALGKLTLMFEGDHPWLTDAPPGWEGSVGPFEAGYSQPHVYARDVHSGAGNCVCGSDLGAELHVQAAPGVDVPDSARHEALTAAGKKLHLPGYIKRIEKHLIGKGMSESHAIATAVNAAKKMCATGDLNFPGSQQVNPGSRAQACAAVAQWKKDRPGSR